MKPHIQTLAAAFASALLVAISVPMHAQETSVRIRTVVLDPGHGGKDAGCVSRDGKTYEKTIALDIATRLSEKIGKEHSGVKVLLTRSDDTYIPLIDRADFANNHNADLFISVHINAQDGGATAHGYSIHCLGQSSRKGNDLFNKNFELCKRENSVILLEDDYSAKYQGFDPNDIQSYIIFNLVQNSNLERSLVFAGDINETMSTGAITYSRGISQDPFFVLWRTTMPAVLVECGFMSNPSDLATLRSPEGRDRIAQSIADAFSTYKKRYETDGAAPKQQVKEAAGEEKPAVVKPAPNGVLFGTQILATGSMLPENDPYFAGYAPLCIKGEKLNRYVIGWSADEAEAKRINKKIKEKFSDSFFVRIEGDSITRIP